MGPSSRSPARDRRDDTPVVALRRHVPVVSLTGDLDLLSVDTVTSAIGSACALAEQTLVVDLSGVAFVDVVGAHALERAHARCFSQGVSVLFAGASPSVARMLHLVRGPHGPVLPLFPSVADAVAGPEPTRVLTG